MTCRCDGMDKEPRATQTHSKWTARRRRAGESWRVEVSSVIMGSEHNMGNRASVTPHYTSEVRPLIYSGLHYKAGSNRRVSGASGDRDRPSYPPAPPATSAASGRSGPYCTYRNHRPGAYSAQEVRPFGSRGLYYDDSMRLTAIAEFSELMGTEIDHHIRLHRARQSAAALLTPVTRSLHIAPTVRQYLYRKAAGSNRRWSCTIPWW